MPWDLLRTIAIAQPGSSLILRNLHPDVTLRVLQTTFQPFGPILSVHLYIYRDTKTGQSVANGVIFENPHDATNALEALNLSEILGQQVHIEVARVEESLFQSWGRRRLDSARTVFTTVWSSPQSMALIGVLILAYICIRSGRTAVYDWEIWRTVLQSLKSRYTSGRAHAKPRPALVPQGDPKVKPRLWPAKKGLVPS